jgi:hypothetical protein
MHVSELTLPSTATRVERSTDESINARLEREAVFKIAGVAAAGHAAMLRRLDELDREWDIERTLQANAASLILVTTTLGFAADRRWFAFPAAIAGFLLLHAVQGWCPPVPVLRRAGVRTAREINLERLALRVLLGDFEQQTSDPYEAFAIAKQHTPS